MFFLIVITSDKWVYEMSHWRSQISVTFVTFNLKNFAFNLINLIQLPTTNDPITNLIMDKNNDILILEMIEILNNKKCN